MIHSFFTKVPLYLIQSDYFSQCSYFFFIFYSLHSPSRLIADFCIHPYFYFALYPYIFKFDAAFGRETGSLAGKEECTSPRDFDRSRRRGRVFSDLGRNYRAEALLLPYANINVTHCMHRPVFNMQM